jgi:hypothetical protein
MEGVTVNDHLLKLSLVGIAGSLLCPNPTLAQLIAPAPKAASVTITQASTLEIAIDNMVIIRWIETNPGGTTEHFGIVKYGKDPNALTQTAKSPTRLNQGHDQTMLRVRIYGLQQQTTYYYTVDSTDGSGASDGVQAP